MDATDFAIGIVLIAILAWVSIIGLNQNATRVSIVDLYARTELNKSLISPDDVCPREQGFELTAPNSVGMQPYHISVGKTDLNQTYFCFYKKVEEEST